MAEQTHTPEQDRQLAEWESAAASITGWTKVMFVMGAGLVLLAFAPDSLVISDSAKTEMPFIGSASIKLVLIAGPLLLVLIRLYVSSHLRRWNKLRDDLGGPERLQETTHSIRNRLPQWTGLVHFPLVATVLIISTWKGLAFPLWGEPMAVLTIGVLAWLTYGAACSGRWLALTILLLIIIVTPAVIIYELMGHTKNGASIDPDEDEYSGSFFLVGCSSPNVPGPGTAKESESENNKEEKEVNGCIGKKEDFNLKEEEEEKKEEKEKEKEEESGKRQNLRAEIRAVIRSLNRFYVIRRQLNFSGAEMLRADLRHMNLCWASMTHADMSDSLFRDAKLQKATAMNADFTGADFGGAQMQNMYLRRARLKNARFWGANLEGATLVNAKLNRANLKTADLTNADLTRADLEEADLRSTILEGAILKRAKLQNTRFQEFGTRRRHPPANLKDADLTEATLTGANLTGANLTGADLKCADLRGVDLGGAKGLEKAKHLSEACMDDETILPLELAGIQRVVSGKCEVRDGRCARKKNSR